MLNAQQHVRTFLRFQSIAISALPIAIHTSIGTGSCYSSNQRLKLVCKSISVFPLISIRTIIRFFCDTNQFYYNLGLSVCNREVAQFWPFAWGSVIIPILRSHVTWHFDRICQITTFVVESDYIICPQYPLVSRIATSVVQHESRTKTLSMYFVKILVSNRNQSLISLILRLFAVKKLLKTPW